MKYLTDILKLSTLRTQDHRQLFQLMKQIYPPVYKHLWPDEGERYLNLLYNPENFKKELANPNSKYYLIWYGSEAIGILRVLLNEALHECNDIKSVKLQRIYLSPSVQGKGIGKQLIQWVEKEFCSQQETILWLEAMDTQQAALNFYQKMEFEIVNHFKFNSEFMKDEYRGMYTMVKKIKK
ncbi:Acetyltransferase (GNAT) family protein [Zhouia amylolytica]|uniref:Acetyltransferase (GNAT) family protein n=1 Tax=Zhouia amylolytica TaxID=376730 RepID=A0A1I6U2J9_9FLAO|nr:GNAT family N-acetyltransferase [Zhouia amylolytica]MCQ0111167.1 GNAT family N-acetyltransferase [Zhouia amylolytica]SFS95604.1 Acetyltransferase (GNAT) family protein [Zhouia amylolytica]